MRVLLVVNSFASSVTARNTVVVHRRCRASHEVEIVETNRRGHATRFAQDAARRGVDVVVGFGGDGTLNEVATGIAGTSAALGVLPGGSTNVFARTLGMPNDPVAAVKLLADGIDDPATSARSGWARSTAATSASTPASATTPRSCGRWRTAPRSSAGPAIPCSSTPR